jgi:hypothetical protein
MRSLLVGDRYNEKTSSRYFPNINVKEAIADCFPIACDRSTSAAIRELWWQLVNEN